MSERVRIESVAAEAFRVPTETPESDGTLEWDSTTMVLATVRADGASGIGYSYTARAGALVTHEAARFGVTWYLTPEPLKATVPLLEIAGYEVDIPDHPVCCGRPLYAIGFLGMADGIWRRTLDALAPHIRAGTPIVGLEPTCVAAFRGELRQMRPEDPEAQALSKQVLLLSEFLLRENFRPARREGRALVHPHCHHHAVIGTDAEIELLKRTGLDVELLDNGCCGMAGDYGFREETYEVAMKGGERRFLPSVREAGDAIYVADGFSCREQARQATGRTLPTLPEVLIATT